MLLLLLLLRRREELSSPLLAVATCVSRVLQIATYNKEIDNSGWARKWALFIPILPPSKWALQRSCEGTSSPSNKIEMLTQKKLKLLNCLLTKKNT